MLHRTSSVIILLAVLIVHRRIALGAPHDPDATGDWPRPELRAGLSDAQIAASIAAYANQLHAASPAAHPASTPRSSSTAPGS